MKRFILLLVPLLMGIALAPAPPAAKAGADTLRYAVAADSNVWFYSSESEEAKVFLLPETYYVRVLNEGERFSAVEYLVNDAPYRKIMGYCETAALTFVDFIPARPFLRKQITVSYSIAADDAFADAFPDVFGSIERTFVYYGLRYENGDRYAYVLYDGTFGYIPIEEEPVFERNDDYLSVPSGSVEGAKPSAKGGLSAIEIVAICIACVAAVAVAALVVRGKRKSAPADPDRTEF